MLCLYIKLQIFSSFDPYHNPYDRLKCLVLKALYHCTIGFLITFIFWKIWWFGKLILAKSEPHDAYSRDAYKKTHVFLSQLGQWLWLVKNIENFIVRLVIVDKSWNLNFGYIIVLFEFKIPMIPCEIFLKYFLFWIYLV